MADPILLTSGTCASCGTLRLFQDMAVFCSTVFGPVADVGLIVLTSPSGLNSNVSGTTFACHRPDWIVGGDCWTQMQGDVLLTGHQEGVEQGIVWRDHDDYQEYALTTMSGVGLATVSGMSSLIVPYQVTGAEADTFTDMRSTATGISLASDVDRNELLVKILRNVDRLPSFDHPSGNFFTYSG